MVYRAWVWSAIHGPALGVAGPTGLSGSGLTHGKEQEGIRKGSEETHRTLQSASQCCLQFSSRSSWCMKWCTVNRYGHETHCLTLPESLLCCEASVDHHSVQFSSVTQLCPTLCDPMDCSAPGLPVHHQLPELTQTHVHLVGDAIQPSHPLLSPSPPAFNLSQHQGLFQWVSSSHQVAKELEFQLQHQSFQWIFRTDLL